MNERFISIIIPNHNGSATIGKCIESAFASRYGRFEVIVVDDCSTDGSAEIISRYPCRLERFSRHAGAGAARNRGAEISRGEILFFTDADCLVRPDTLSRVNRAVGEHPEALIGGTYAQLSQDGSFWSDFQSLFIHYSETRKTEPDYVATHAMAARAAVFKKSGGFREEFLPLLEDVEFSHRIRRSGRRLVMEPEIQVRHVFNFTLIRSLRNAFRKSMYWTAYSLANRDVLADSGTASAALKANVMVFFLNALLAVLALHRGEAGFLLPAPFLLAADLFFSKGLLMTFFRAKGIGYAAGAACYYAAVYPIPVAAGAAAGALSPSLIRGARRAII